MESDIYLRYGHCQIEDIDPNKQYKIVGGFDRTKLEDFINHDWIDSSGQMPMLFNKRLVKKIQALCPNDFIALPVTIINLTDEVESYQNRDFYIVSAINTLDAIDKEKSVIDEYQRVEKPVYKENPWDGHLLAFEKNVKGMVWHPKLAKELYPSKQFQFFTPEEDGFLCGFYIPEGHNRETFTHWVKGVVKTMSYPRKSLFKFMGEEYAHKKETIVS
ncbi:MAG: hypothetical protein Tsb006_5460 [Rickettsiaceae bacterium]